MEGTNERLDSGSREESFETGLAPGSRRDGPLGSDYDTLSANTLGRLPREHPRESRSEPELAAPPSTPGSVSLVVLCYHQVQAFGRLGPITGSLRDHRRARLHRSDVVFTPVTTHSSGREKVTVSRWCDHEWLS